MRGHKFSRQGTCSYRFADGYRYGNKSAQNLTTRARNDLKAAGIPFEEMLDTNRGTELAEFLELFAAR